MKLSLLLVFIFFAPRVQGDDKCVELGKELVELVELIEKGEVSPKVIVPFAKNPALDKEFDDLMTLLNSKYFFSKGPYSKLVPHKKVIEDFILKVKANQGNPKALKHFLNSINQDELLLESFLREKKLLDSGVWKSC